MANRNTAMHWGMSSLAVAMLSFAGVFGDQGLLMGVVFMVIGAILIVIGA